MIQQGIYADRGERPPQNWAMLFLQATRDSTATQVGQQMDSLWGMLQRLRIGLTDQLPGVKLPSAKLDVLIGYGLNIFGLAGVRHTLPADLRVAKFRPPQVAGGGRILAGSGINYASNVAKNPATEDIAIQLTAATPLGISRAIVEIQLLLEKLTQESERPVLKLVETYTGFNREDHRSWIDFHDGISNMRSGDERFSALVVDDEDAATDVWTRGGTYLAFIRLGVDIAGWRRLSQTEQELVVGRTKISGCPLVRVGPTGPVAVAGCPIAGTQSVSETGNDAFFEPPRGIGDQIIRKSHVQRANHHDSPAEESSLRVYRQGYEFLEPPSRDRALLAGLNFVSFQDKPDRLLTMIQQPGWLGNVNFGGDDDNQPPEIANLLRAYAAAFFLCPKAEPNLGLPGRSIFWAT